MRVADKVVIVTGAASGIGRALAQRFAAEGARAVIVADLDGEGANRVAAGINGVGMAVDVAEESQVVQLVRSTEERFGRIDLLCSNAGIARADGDPGYATSGSNADWEASFKINVMAHVYAARAALPAMLRRGSGYFLHTASAAGLLSQIGSASYSTTKHAAIGFAESLAITHGDDGIGVSVLCPQGVRTPMLGEDAADSPQAGDGIMEPEEVAQSVVEGLANETFLILPHPDVSTYVQRKTADPDRWLRGMRRLRSRLSGKSGLSGP